ncbi:MAG: hypothetical protein U0270_24930 [Labilithrix sp.]
MPSRSSALLLALVLVACTRTPAATSEPTSKPDAAASSSAALTTAAPPLPVQRFDTPEAAFRFVLEKNPQVLAVGEAHAQKGTEAIASSTKRFTEGLLPILAPKASDVVVELWAPDPTCMKEVKAVASAQKPVTSAQAETNQNEYQTLGVKAKAAGMTPWLLRPTCNDFSMLADAGEDAVGQMLGLVKRLTQEKLVQLMQKNGGAKTVVAYGGALHNDLKPSPEMKQYSFGPELDELTKGRYVELDLIVPEYIKRSPTWEKLPWFASFEADKAANKFQDKTTLYVLGERSFTLIFPASQKAN